MPFPTPQIEAATPTPCSAFRAWAVYADFDGNAPDTKDLVLCASEPLAQAAAEFLAWAADEQQANCYNGADCDPDADGVAVPSVDEANRARNFVVRETVASRVCTTWDEVLADLR